MGEKEFTKSLRKRPPPLAPAERGMNPWLRAGLLEGTGRDEHPWRG